MNQRVKTPIGVRFCDTDMLGHINNCAVAEYAEFGRVEFFRHLTQKAQHLILVNLNIDFTAQMHLDDEIRIETWVEAIGNTSITLAQEIMAKGVVSAKTRAVMLTFDYEKNQAVRVPQEFRDELRPFMVEQDA